MTTADIIYVHEINLHNAQIENLNAEAFGPSRFTRAAYFIREGGPHDLGLSFVALEGALIIASIRQTPIVIGTTPALLLGPIVVRPEFKNAGIGAKLMHMAIEAATKENYKLILLVGDEPYYRRFGFKQANAREIIMPAPVDPARLLIHEISAGAAKNAKGPVRHINYTR